MDDSRGDSLASLLPGQYENVVGPKTVAVRLRTAVCGFAFVIGLVSALAIYVQAQRNRSLESSYDSQAVAEAARAAGKPIIVFPTGDLFKQPTRFWLHRTSKPHRNRSLQAAPRLVERDSERWRLVKVTRRHRTSRTTYRTRATTRKDLTGTSSAQPFGRLLNGSLEKEPYDAATESSRPLPLVQSTGELSERDLRLNSELTGEKYGENATENGMPESAINSTGVVRNSSAILLIPTRSASHGTPVRLVDGA